MKKLTILTLNTIILTFAATTSATPYNNVSFLELEKNHAQCIEQTYAKTMQNVPCSRRIDFKATNLKIKYFCDAQVDSKLSKPNSQTEMNDLRDLRERTALTAYRLFERKNGDIEKNCQISKFVKQEIRRTDSNIKIVEGIQ